MCHWITLQSTVWNRRNVFYHTETVFSGQNIVKDWHFCTVKRILLTNQRLTCVSICVSAEDSGCDMCLAELYGTTHDSYFVLKVWGFVHQSWTLKTSVWHPNSHIHYTSCHVTGKKQNNTSFGTPWYCLGNTLRIIVIIIPFRVDVKRQKIILGKFGTKFGVPSQQNIIFSPL